MLRVARFASSVAVDPDPAVFPLAVRPKLIEFAGGLFSASITPTGRFRPTKNRGRYLRQLRKPRSDSFHEAQVFFLPPQCAYCSKPYVMSPVASALPQPEGGCDICLFLVFFSLFLERERVAADAFWPIFLFLALSVGQRRCGLTRACFL